MSKYMIIHSILVSGEVQTVEPKKVILLEGTLVLADERCQGI